MICKRDKPEVRGQKTTHVDMTVSYGNIRATKTNGGPGWYMSSLGWSSEQITPEELHKMAEEMERLENV